jgi:hypothetical protein
MKSLMLGLLGLMMGCVVDNSTLYSEIVKACYPQCQEAGHVWTGKIAVEPKQVRCVCEGR